MTNFTDDFNNIFNGLQSLRNHLEVELNNLNQRISYLEYKQNQDDEFYKDLELLIQKRNK